MTRSILPFLLAIPFLSNAAYAQLDVSFAGYVGYNIEFENPMIGLGLDVDGLGQVGPIRGGAWVDIETQLDDNGSVIQADLNFTPKYDIGQVEATVGGGIAWQRFSPEGGGDSVSNTGWNILAGAMLNMGSINPFARFRCSTFDGNSQETLFGGVMVQF